ncbi:MAG: BrnT family toxin [Zoogloeaceae bacterium]|jgi:uncharacterized DUF497 family protein|nr:BrnT family toxin [Zoogloeaceae bacterium]
MNITFDPAKASVNLKKHGISFEEAATCLLDQMARVREDDDAVDEQRFVLLGMSIQARLLVVVYALRGEDVRIISARKPTKKEERDYA